MHAKAVSSPFRNDFFIEILLRLAITAVGAVIRSQDFPSQHYLLHLKRIVIIICLEYMMFCLKQQHVQDSVPATLTL